MHKLLSAIGLFCMLLPSLHGQAQSSWADSTLNTMNLDEKIAGACAERICVVVLFLRI